MRLRLKRNSRGLVISNTQCFITIYATPSGFMAAEDGHVLKTLIMFSLENQYPESSAGNWTGALEMYVGSQAKKQTSSKNHSTFQIYSDQLLLF